ncbi:hypothetical protein [Candidatus Thiodiazotropha sp. CDECU1]|uniref:hypothetical protein n=1 Tax=Candidatus Thiodiazotropha sp. CDECU1 TaxID=3065865 RepID=UPI0029316FD6|nr:hypothetical protein [Candidatus Thiodiazotropha sp. CDECU1]
MECINHEVQAKGICNNCGKGLCSDCIQFTPSNKLSCSEECTSEITIRETVVSQTLNKTKNSALSGAYGSYVLGAIFIWFGFYTKISELQLFTITVGVGMLAMGAFFHYAAKSKSKQS